MRRRSTGASASACESWDEMNIQSQPYLRTLSPFEVEILAYVANPGDVTSVTAEDVISHFGGAECAESLVAMTVAYLTANLYITCDLRTMALSTNCFDNARTKEDAAWEKK